MGHFRFTECTWFAKICGPSLAARASTVIWEAWAEEAICQAVSGSKAVRECWYLLNRVS